MRHTRGFVTYPRTRVTSLGLSGSDSRDFSDLGGRGLKFLPPRSRPKLAFLTSVSMIRPTHQLLFSQGPGSDSSLTPRGGDPWLQVLRGSCWMSFLLDVGLRLGRAALSSSPCPSIALWVPGTSQCGSATAFRVPQGSGFQRERTSGLRGTG